MTSCTALTNAKIAGVYRSTRVDADDHVKFVQVLLGIRTENKITTNTESYWLVESSISLISPSLLTQQWELRTWNKYVFSLSRFESVCLVNADIKDNHTE